MGRGGSVSCSKCSRAANQLCPREQCRNCCQAAARAAIASGTPSPRCAPHAIRKPNKPSKPLVQPGPAALTANSSDSSDTPSSSQPVSSDPPPSQPVVSASLNAASESPLGSQARSPQCPPDTRPTQYAQPLRSRHEMPQPWLSARQQAYDKIGPAQRKSSIHEAQKQIQHSIGLSLWLKPATEAVEITSVHVTTYPAFRLSDYPTFRDMLCPPQSSSPFVHIYDPKTNKWSIIAADSYRQITGGETSLLLRTIPSLSAPDFDPMEYPGMAEAMQALRRKRSFATVDDLLPMSSNSAGSAKRARLDSESAIAPRAPSPLRICSSPGPGRITEPDEHFPRVSRASLSSDWRALRSGVTGTIPSNNLPTIDEELVTEGTESSMGRSASVGSPEPSMSSGASTTDVPAPASATLSVPTIPTGFKARSYGSDDLSFPKSLPFTDIYNGLVKVHNLTSQRVPQVGRASACSLAWPKYEWQKKRCKGYDDARADLGRGDADIWQRCLNTPNALWGDYTRYLGTLGRSSAKPLHFPWDPDGGRPSQPSADTEPEASEPPTSSESVKTTILSPPSTVVAQANQLLSSISDVAQANDTSPPSHARAPSEPPPPPMIAQGNDSPPASPPAVDELPSLQITWASEPPPPSQNPGNEVLSPPMIVQTNDPLPPTMLVAQMSESLPSLQIAWASEPPPLMLAQAELPSLPTIAQTKNPLPPPSMVELLASDNPLQHINPTYPSFDPEVPSWDAAAPTCTAYYGPSGWYPVLDTIAPSSIESYTDLVQSIPGELAGYLGDLAIPQDLSTSAPESGSATSPLAG